jgi:hypothetical protein
MNKKIAMLASSVLLTVGLVACPTPVTPPPPPPPPPEQVTTQLILNGGFEVENTNWTFEGGAVRVVSADKKTGTAFAALGKASTGSLKVSQLINVPAAGNTTLKYSIKIASNEAADASFDSIVVRAGTTIINTLTVANTRGQYVEYSSDLSAFKGGEVLISFSASFDASVLTTFCIDDVSAANVR